MATERPPEYQAIVAHYEECLKKFGDTHQGVDWPNPEDARRRYQVMLDLIRPGGSEVSLLDFGCGAAHLKEYLTQAGIPGIRYSGLDISQDFIDLCRRKFPGVDFYRADLLVSEGELPGFDFVVMNGVFTEKRSLSFDEMFAYFRKLLAKSFALAEKGLAFNVMSKHVDWERDDLFHLPFDRLAAFLRAEVTPHFVIRNDYGLYEYTVYLYHEPVLKASAP